MSVSYWRLQGNFPGRSSGHYFVEDDGAGEYVVWQDQGGPLTRLPRGRGLVEDALMAAGVQIGGLSQTSYQPGEYHPRIWRPINWPRARVHYEKEWASAQGAALNLFVEMHTVFRYIEPAGNGRAYGDEIRQLLILACTEVEAQCKGVLRANHYDRYTTDRTGKRRQVQRKNWNMPGDYQKVGRALRLADYKVKLRGHPALPALQPFAAWATGTSAPLPWYADYNKVKHDRLLKFRRATLENMIDAMAAVHILVCAQFGQFGRWYSGGYSEMDAFDEVERPTFGLVDHYVLPEIVAGTAWHPVDYKF